ncbi:type II secretion system protein [bacterium]|nr:type II secretion system protein [bacterium]
MKKIFAFTLAETLIVMGVIGIVSALTLPNLNSSTGDKEKVAKVKKIYQNLNDAFGRAEAVYGPYSEWHINDNTEQAKTKRTGERLAEFMKLSKDCSNSTNQSCMNNSGYDSNDKIYKFILADGASVAIDSPDSGSPILVDIDGPAKGSFANGKDLFYFELPTGNDSTMGIIPQGYNLSFNDLKGASRNSYGATWIIKYDNADYLKLTDNNGTCQNGTTVTEANPRCK